MKIIRSDKSKTILLNTETNFGTDLGWEEGFQEFEHETLKSIINPTENFETVRYIHAPYTGLSGMTQYDLWQEFYFLNSAGGHEGGLNYERTGLSSKDNYKLSKSDKTSFFRLEFYKVPSGETPTSINRKLVFTKNLPITTGEEVYYSPIRHNVFVPVFMGGNYRKKENMFLYWFQDDTALDGSIFAGNDFYLAAKFYNALDGTSITFLNKEKSPSDVIDEENDVYRKVVIDKSDYTYIIYTGITENHRAGTSNTYTPIRWYAADVSQKIGGYQPRVEFTALSTGHYVPADACDDPYSVFDTMYLQEGYTDPAVGLYFYETATGTQKWTPHTPYYFKAQDNYPNGTDNAVYVSNSASTLGRIGGVVRCLS